MGARHSNLYSLSASETCMV